MFLKFNNNNVWEVVDHDNGGNGNGNGDNSVIFYRRVLTPHALRTVHIDEEIDEDKMFTSTDPSFFNYTDWKIFFGEEKLKKLGVDVEKERYVLPMLYYSIFIMGLTDMVRERETKFIFKKRN